MKEGMMISDQQEEKMNSVEKTFHIPVGYRCNNNCVFCMEKRENKGKKNISYYKDLIEKGSKDFDKIITMGLEPTMNDLLPKIFKHAKKTGYKDIFMVTNGRMLQYKEYCNLLVESGLTSIAISIHGHNKELHDSLTMAEGSFIQTSKGTNNIMKLREEGKIKRFVINTTITKINLKHLEEIYDYNLKFKPDKIIFNYFIPKGKAKKRIEKMMPKYSDVAKSLENLNDKNKRNFSIIGFPLCVSKNLINNIGVISDYHIIDDGSYKRDSTKGMIKLGRCRQCNTERRCQGIFEEYITRFGDDEFKPRN